MHARRQTLASGLYRPFPPCLVHEDYVSVDPAPAGLVVDVGLIVDDVVLFDIDLSAQ